MRKQIAAANWKMNLTEQEGIDLISAIATDKSIELSDEQVAVFAVPFPYLSTIKKHTDAANNFFVAAQNCAAEKAGAYTGEVSAQMLQSIGIKYVVIGHSERREYYNETSNVLVKKIEVALQNNLTVIFCCGEPLQIREASTQNEHIANQLAEGLFNLTEEQLQNIVIAYEPIWAIGTGKTATSDEAQQMHAHIRATLAAKYGNDVANNTSILYGGSVKGTNAAEIFGKPDVDGGLVGGASLVATEFITIINSLKK